MVIIKSPGESKSNPRSLLKGDPAWTVSGHDLNRLGDIKSAGAELVFEAIAGPVDAEEEAVKKSTSAAHRCTWLQPNVTRALPDAVELVLAAAWRNVGVRRELTLLRDVRILMHHIGAHSTDFNIVQ
jgi:hypothetical protein